MAEKKKTVKKEDNKIEEKASSVLGISSKTKAFESAAETEGSKNVNFSAPENSKEFSRNSKIAEEKETIETPLKEETKKKQNKQIIIAITFMIAVIAIVIIIPIVNNYLFNKFIYTNLEFQKTKLGEIRFYSTRIPFVTKQPAEDHLITSEEIAGYYSTNFRNDPRKLEYIRLNLTFNNSDQIAFMKANTVYISLDPEMEKCDDNSLALINFAGFLRDFAGLTIKSAVSDENASLELKIPYVSCKKNKFSTIINIKSGNETKIERTGDNCYVLTYSNCEITQVTEKFDILILKDYMEYFEERKKQF